MEGLQGFGWGILLSSLFWLPTLIMAMAKAYKDGHFAGQQHQIDLKKEAWK